MTKEELKQEAEEKCVCTDEAMRIMYGIGYIDGAEQREKRITKLEAQIEKMKCCENCKYSNQDGSYTIVCKVGGVDKTHYIEIDDNQVCDKWEIKEK